jgi:hypothetical protein
MVSRTSVREYFTNSRTEVRDTNSELGGKSRVFTVVSVWFLTFLLGNVEKNANHN